MKIVGPYSLNENAIEILAKFMASFIFPKLAMFAKSMDRG